MDNLLVRKEQLDDDLRDLSFEYHAGKHSKEDYQTQRTQLENEAAQLLVEMKHLQPE
jgi:hypothetical protein